VNQLGEHGFAGARWPDNKDGVAGIFVENFDVFKDTKNRIAFADVRSFRIDFLFDLL
jgi:hypothetical protein